VSQGDKAKRPVNPPAVMVMVLSSLPPPADAEWEVPEGSVELSSAGEAPMRKKDGYEELKKDGREAV
jgi:hypothetical protein